MDAPWLQRWTASTLLVLILMIFVPHIISRSTRLPLRYAVNRRHVSTFNVSKLTEDDFLDLSGKRRHQLQISTFGPRARLNFRCEGTVERFVPFPVHTRGFLYFRPGPEHAPIAGELRFRQTSSSSPEQFAEGHDLHMDIYPDIPWSVTLNSVLKSRHDYVPIAASLLQDELIGEKLLYEARNSLISPRAPKRSLIHSLGQSFVLDLQIRQPMMTIAHGSEQVRFGFNLPADGRHGLRLLPWTGTNRIFEKALLA
jgi:hypothetical protein